MRHLAAYAAVMLLAVGSGAFGVWQSADLWLFARLQLLARPQLAGNLVLVDVPYTDELRRAGDPTAFRRDVGALLVRLARDPQSAPREVILDLYIDKDPRGLEALAEGLDALAKARVRRYAVVCVGKPDCPPGPDLDPAAMSAPVGAIYAALDNFGHTQIAEAGGVLWYETRIGGRAALPVALQDNFHELADALPERLVVPLGDPADTRRVSFCHRAGAACWGGLAPLGERNLRDARVIVGSFEADLANPLRRPGPELLAWAISDMSAQGSSRGLAPLNSAAAVLGIALVAGLAAAGTFHAGYRVARVRLAPAALPRRLPWLAIAALGAGFALWLALWSLLHAQRLALPAVLPWMSLAAASVLSWHRGRRAADEALYAATRDDGTAPIEHDVFISYAHQPPEDADWVKRQVYAPLLAANLKVFFDEGSIRRGRDWKREIDRAIAGSRVFLPVYTARYFQSPQCVDELAYAEQRRSSGKLTVLPVTRIAMGEVPEIYQKVQATEAARVADLLAEVRAACAGGAASASPSA